MTRNDPLVFSLHVGPIEQLSARFRQLLEAQCRLAVADHGHCTLAIPGGSIARAFLPDLITARVAWEKIHVFFTDERAVPPDDEASNYHVAREALFGRAPATAAQLHRMSADSADLDLAAFDAERELAATLGPARQLDLVLLGVGEDGHVGSLFPGQEALDEQERMVIPVTRSPKPPSGRLSLTLPAICAADALCIAAFGEAKSDVMHAALYGLDESLPVSRAIRNGRNVTVFLDYAAASRLPSGST